MCISFPVLLVKVLCFTNIAIKLFCEEDQFERMSNDDLDSIEIDKDSEEKYWSD